MVLARIETASTLKTILDALSSMVDAVSIDFTDEGMMMQAMDSSHVSLCFLTLGSEGFQEYECERNTSVGLNLVHASKIMKCATGDDSVSLHVGQDEDFVDFRVAGKGDSARASSFQLRLMDVQQERLNIPPVDYSCVVVMRSSEFQKTVRDLLVMGDTCRVCATPERVTFSASGDIGKASMDVDVVENLSKGTVSMEFALRYMSLFTRASSLSDKVSIMMSNDCPMCIEYDMGDVGSLKYFLAPKIDDE